MPTGTLITFKLTPDVALRLLTIYKLLKYYSNKKEVQWKNTSNSIHNSKSYIVISHLFEIFIVYHRIPKVTGPLTFRFSSQKALLHVLLPFSGSCYFGMVKNCLYHGKTSFRQSGHITNKMKVPFPYVPR